MARGLDNAAVAELYARYGYLVERRCRLLLRDDGLAEDATQETFVRALRYGDRIRDTDSPLRWLYRTSDRCCFDLLGRRRRLVLADPPDDAGAHPRGRLEARDTVIGFLDRLGDRDRQIAVLAFVDGLTQDRIAAEIGTSRVTVNKRLGRIRARARVFFEENEGETSDG